MGELAGLGPLAVAFCFSPQHHSMLVLIGFSMISYVTSAWRLCCYDPPVTAVSSFLNCDFILPTYMCTTCISLIIAVQIPYFIYTVIIIWNYPMLLFITCGHTVFIIICDQVYDNSLYEIHTGFA